MNYYTKFYIFEKEMEIYFMVDIKFKLKLICILEQLDREITIEFFVPQIFNNYKSAENANCSYYVKPAKLETGEIVFKIYKKGQNTFGILPQIIDTVVDTVRWEEYWKYESTIMKESSIGLGYVDYTDYEPYADKFNDMYHKYLTDRSFEDVSRYSLQNIAYEIVPIVFHKQCYT
jgi:hypothetical protein